MTMIVSAYFRNEALTRQFLDNLIGKLPSDCGLILVNAGSEPIDHPIITKRIDLAENHSFANSMNAGIKETQGDVCIIGNDVFPETSDWLERLQESKADIIAPVPNQPTQEKIEEVDFTPAVCWLMSRECIDTVGLFDERFVGGTFEDNDYCRRVKEAGGRILVDYRVSVKHLVNQTVNLLGGEGKLMSENAQRYKEKWD